LPLNTRHIPSFEAAIFDIAAPNSKCGDVCLAVVDWRGVKELGEFLLCKEIFKAVLV
jgi:hypothetical protein